MLGRRWLHPLTAVGVIGAVCLFTVRPLVLGSWGLHAWRFVQPAAAVTALALPVLGLTVARVAAVALGDDLRQPGGHDHALGRVLAAHLARDVVQL